MQISDPAALRALAHPTRQKIVYHLDVHRHGRATDIAQAIGEPANSVSFHLRALAKAGLVVEVPELARDKRDRVWRNAADSFDVAPGTPGLDAIARQIGGWLRQLATADPTALKSRPGMANIAQLRLSPDEARALREELGGVVDRWSQRMRDQATAVDGGSDAADNSRVHYTLLVATGPTNLDRPPE